MHYAASRTASLATRVEAPPWLKRCSPAAAGARRYRACDASGRHHHQLACTQRRRVMEFSYCMPERQIEEIGKQESFSVEGLSLTIYGRCEACRELEAS
jgi:Fe2+ or Zn2+ uptake regulation protein